MNLSFLEMIELIAAYHAGLMGVVVVLHPRLRGLGLICLNFSLHMFVNLGVGTGLIPNGLDITSAFGLLYGPLFYLFVQDLTFEGRQTRWLDSLHALPALAVAILRPADPIPHILGFPSLVIYIGLGLLALRDHRRLTAQIRSDDAAVSLRWVEIALGTFAAVAIVDISRELGVMSAISISDDVGLSGVLIAVLVLLSTMAARALEHEKRHGAVPTETEAAGREGHDTQRGNPDDERAFAALDTLVREEELWREMRFSLADLARQSGMSARDVSRAVNAGAGMSFSRYINNIRVEAVDRLMAVPGNSRRTIIELAYEVGFNSKSAFNRIYREQTGQTPTQAMAAYKNPAKKA
jgi:AraC-like DNA-binding protein